MPLNQSTFSSGHKFEKKREILPKLYWKTLPKHLLNHLCTPLKYWRMYVGSKYYGDTSEAIFLSLPWKRAIRRGQGIPLLTRGAKKLCVGQNKRCLSTHLVRPATCFLLVLIAAQTCWWQEQECNSSNTWLAVSLLALNCFSHHLLFM